MFATSGILPSTDSSMNLTYSAGKFGQIECISVHVFALIFLSACAASNDPIEDRFVIAFSRLSSVFTPTEVLVLHAHDQRAGTFPLRF
jgi:hypothetical protein